MLPLSKRFGFNLSDPSLKFGQLTRPMERYSSRVLTEQCPTTGTVSSVVAWQREGRFLRGRDVRRIPYVGNWLAEHVPRWRDDSPRKKAAAAATRRAKVCNVGLRSGDSVVPATFYVGANSHNGFILTLCSGAFLVTTSVDPCGSMWCGSGLVKKEEGYGVQAVYEWVWNDDMQTLCVPGIGQRVVDCQACMAHQHFAHYTKALLDSESMSQATIFCCCYEGSQLPDS